MEESRSLGQQPRLLLRGGARSFRPSPFEKVLFLTLFAVAAFGGYSLYARATDLNAELPAPPTYLPAFRTNLTSTISATGTVQSSQQVTLTFGSSGKIQSFGVRLGDRVTAGQELAKIDSTELQQALKSAQSALASALARYQTAALGSTASDVATGQQSLLNAQGQVATAQKNLDDLLAKPTLTDLATAQQGVLSAQNALQSANDALTKAQTEVKTAETGVQTAEANLDAADKNRELAYNAMKNAYDSSPNCPAPPSKYNAAPFVPATCANTTYTKAVADYGVARDKYLAAQTAVTTAKTTLSSAENAVSNGNLQRSIQSAQIGLTTAQQKQAETLAGAKPIEIDAARRSLDSAIASLTAAQAKYDDLFKPPAADVILPLQNSVDQAQANVETAKKNLAAATIVAPFDGQISQLTGEVGSQVSATTAVFILLNPSLIRIDANVDQADVSNVAAEQMATVTFDALPGRTYQAQVAAVGLTPTIQQGVVSYVVTLGVDTSRLTQGTPIPAPGMTASISVTTSRTDSALVVPSRAIRRSGRTATVTLHTDSGDEQRQVTTGVTNGTLIQVLSGLNEGDEVLVSSPTTSTTTTTNRPAQQQQFGGPGGGLGVPLR